MHSQICLHVVLILLSKLSELFSSGLFSHRYLKYSLSHFSFSCQNTAALRMTGHAACCIKMTGSQQRLLTCQEGSSIIWVTGVPGIFFFFFATPPCQVDHILA